MQTFHWTPTPPPLFLNRYTLPHATNQRAKEQCRGDANHLQQTLLSAIVSQALGKLEGNIKCLRECSSDMQVSVATQSGTKSRFPVTVLEDGTAHFSVANLALELFTVSISKPSWCFTPKSVPVMVNPDHTSVNGEVMDSIDFHQRGYSLKIVVRCLQTRMSALFSF